MKPPSIRQAPEEPRRLADRGREPLRQSCKQLRALSLYLQFAREEECIRIARQVHAEIGQALTGMKLELTWLANHLSPRQRGLHLKAGSISGHMDETLGTIRRIAGELRPGLLDTAGLVAALKWEAQEFQRRTGIRCRVMTAIPETLLDQDLNTAFFRIFQEALTNILRHARATRVEVRLLEQSGHLVLEVKDNGCGISKDEIHTSKSIGLLGMRERAALLDGEVLWNGSPDKGTTVRVRIPHPSGRTGNHHRYENPH